MCQEVVSTCFKFVRNTRTNQEHSASMHFSGADQAIDGNSATKWFDYTRSALTVQLASPAKVEAGASRVRKARSTCLDRLRPAFSHTHLG